MHRSDRLRSTHRPVWPWRLAFTLAAAAGAQAVQAQATDPVGRLESVLGVCRTRTTGETFWRSIQIGEPLVPGQRVVCSEGGALRLALPGSGEVVATPLEADAEYVVPRGRATATPREGTRPGLRANVAPSAAPSGTPAGIQQLMTTGVAQTQSETQLREAARLVADSAPRRVPGVATLGALGALAALLGEGNRNMGVAGAVVGGMRGSYPATKLKEADGDAQKALAAIVADLRADQVQANVFARASRAAAEEGRARLAELKAGLDSQSIDEPSAEITRRRERQNVALLATTLGAIRETREQYSAAMQIAGLEPDRLELVRGVAQLDRVVSEVQARLTEYRLGIAQTERPAAASAPAVR